MAMEFQFGDWLVSPESNIVSNGDAKTQLEPRVMAVLRYLCRHPGAVIPAEEILQACWGSNELGDNPVHKAITQLRRAFGDSTTEPRYIETIRKRGYRAIAPVVTLAAPAPTTWEGGSPFRGLEAFQENHAAIFFGRVQATAQLRELVMTQAAHGCPMALVLGPSGSGKTSLVRAGLFPQLMAGATRSDEPIGLVSTVYLDCADLGSGTLFQALAGALIDADINGEPLFPGASADSLGQRLADDPDSVAAELRNRSCARIQVGVLVDRLEAVFRADAHIADHFICVIDTLAKSNCLLMLMACRNDFYPEVMAHPVLLASKTCGGHFDVLPPDGADIAQIVRQPALAANLIFEIDQTTGASLDDVLCDAARGNPDMLPLLQYTLNELYRQRGDEATLKFEVYRELGGIEGAVGVRAEQVVTRLNPSQVASLPQVLSLLVNVGEEQSAITSRRSPLAMLRSEDERELVRVMVEARLFVSELAGDVPSFGVAHEALLRCWPRVVKWIEQYRHAIQLRTRLTSQATRWSATGKSRDLLLPSGIQVTQAAELMKLENFSLAPIESEFVRSSVSRARFRERIRLAVTSLIAILAILAGGLGIAARKAQNEAEQRRADAEELVTYMLGDFVDKLRPIGRLEMLDDVSKKALEYLSRPQTSADSVLTKVQRAKALRVIAEVDMSRARRSESVEALTAARKLLDTIPKELGNDRALLQELALNSYMLGLGSFHSNELDAAETRFLESVAFSDRFAATAPDDIEGWVQQSHAYSSLGNLAMKRNDYPNAEKHFSRSMELKQRALKKKGNDPKLAADLANSISWLAETKVKTGKLQDAMRLYKEEESLLRPIQSNNSTWTQRLALSLWRQSLLKIAFGQREAALDDLHQAEVLMKKVVGDDPTNTNWQTRLHMLRLRLIEIGDPSLSNGVRLEQLHTIQDAMQALSAREPKNLSLAYQAAKVEYVHGAVAFEAGRRDQGIKMMDQSIDSFKSLRSLAKTDALFAAYYSEALLKRSEYASNEQTSREYCGAARAALNGIPIRADYTLLSLQVRASACLGELAEVTNQRQQLETMLYREPQYLRYLSNHPLKKGNL